MSNKMIFNVRRFLNRKNHHSTAFIYGYLSKTFSKGEKNKKTGKMNKDELWFDYELKISDCDRMISLCIDTHDKSSIKNTLFKLDTLINTLLEFRKVYTKEMEIYLKLKKDGKIE